MKDVRISYSRLLLITAACLLTFSLAFSAHIYVDPVNGNDNNSGVDENNALRTITEATSNLGSSNSTEADPEYIHLAAGTYDSNSGEDFPIYRQFNRTLFYAIIEGPEDGEAFIDGEDEFVRWHYFIWLKNSRNTNTSGFELRNVSLTGFEGVVALEGFNNSDIAIDNVFADDFHTPRHHREGSAFLFFHCASNLTFTNSEINDAKSNWDGGTIRGATITGDVTIQNCNFNNSYASRHGGAIYLYGPNNVLIEDVNISESSGSWGGGGIYLCYAGGTTEFTRINIEDCSATCGNGGGIELWDLDQDATFDTISVQYCTSKNYGGAISIFSNGWSEYSASFTNASLCDNVVTYGCGGALTYDAQDSFSMDIFTVANNSSKVEGGGLCIYSPDVTLKNGNIYKNVTGDDNSYNQARGGGLHLRTQSRDMMVNINNIYVWENEVYGNGGGLYLSSWHGWCGGSWRDMDVNISNSVFHDNNAITSGWGCNRNNGYGGGIFSFTRGFPVEPDSIVARYRNLLITKNGADRQGGGLYIENRNTVDLVNLTISDNLAGYSNESIFFYGGDPNDDINETIDATDDNESYDLNIYNSIVWGNGASVGGDTRTYSDQSINFMYSNVEADDSGIVEGDGNMNFDPLFKDTELANYYPIPGSRMFDRGMPWDENEHPYADYQHESFADAADTIRYGSEPDEVIIIDLNSNIDVGFWGGTIGAGLDCEHCGLDVDFPGLDTTTPGDPYGGQPGDTINGIPWVDLPPPPPGLPSKVIYLDKYTMIGIPVNPSVPLMQDIPRVSFGDDVAGTVPEWSSDPLDQTWRISRWANDFPYDDDQLYNGYLRYLQDEPGMGRDIGDPPNLKPGLGFWFAYNVGSREEQAIYIDIMKDMLDPAPYEIGMDAARSETQPSLNMMANPWPFRIDWQQVEFQTFGDTPSGWVDIDAAVTSGWLSRYAYTWNPHTFNFEVNTGNLDPWEGFFLITTTTDSIAMKFNPIQSSASLADQTHLDELDELLDWSLLISARRVDKLQVDFHNWIGVGEDLDDLMDDWDATQLAPMAKEAIFFRTRTQDAENGNPRDRLCYDFRNSQFDSSGVKAWWSELFFYSDDVSGTVYPVDIRLNWPTIAAIDEDIYFSLHEFNGPTFNPETDAAIVQDMRETHQAIITTDQFYNDRYAYKRFWIVAHQDAFETNSPSEVDSDIPLVTELAGSYPNPFNSMTNIKFNVAAATNVKIAVYNILGQRVAELINNNFQPGFHNVSWDASLNSSGIYFVRFETGSDIVNTRKLVLVR
jgi:Secretion system C-terminal sorting domain/Protein of unknown function (DUF1565)